MTLERLNPYTIRARTALEALTRLNAAITDDLHMHVHSAYHHGWPSTPSLTTKSDGRTREHDKSGLHYGLILERQTYTLTGQGATATAHVEIRVGEARWSLELANLPVGGADTIRSTLRAPALPTLNGHERHVWDALRVKLVTVELETTSMAEVVFEN